MNRDFGTIAIIGVIILGAFGILIAKSFDSTNSTNQLFKNQELILGDERNILGNKNAKVYMIEFGDYECPSCAKANPIINEIISSYKTNPNFAFVYRNFPLPQHKNAVISAQAAEAAGKFGKFFEMHDMLYQKQDEWSGLEEPLSVFKNYAKSLGIDPVKFEETVKSDEILNLVKKDLDDAQKLNLNHTPTLIINGREAENFDPNKLKEMIDSALLK